MSLNTSDNSFKTLTFFQPQPLFPAVRPRKSSFHTLSHTKPRETPSKPAKPVKPLSKSIQNYGSSSFLSKPQEDTSQSSQKHAVLQRKFARIQQILEKTPAFLNTFAHLQGVLKLLNAELLQKTVLFKADHDFLNNFLEFQLSLAHFFEKIAAKLQKPAEFPEFFSNPQNFHAQSLEKPAVSSISRKKPQFSVDAVKDLLAVFEEKLHKTRETPEKTCEKFQENCEKTQSFASFQLDPLKELQKEREIREKTFAEVLFSKDLAANELKSGLLRLEREISEEKTRNNALLRENQRFLEKIEELSQEKQRLREIALMQLEETREFQRKCEDLFVFLKKLREKSRVLEAKVAKLTGNRIENPEGPEEKAYAADLSLFSIVKARFSEKSFRKPQNSKLLQLYNKELWSHNQEKLNRLAMRAGNQALFSEENEEINGFLLTKPGFFAFVDHKFLAYSSEIHAFRSDKISSMFLATLRGILDSYFREICLGFAKSFPEFLYAWLGKMSLLPFEREMRELNQKEQFSADDMRIGFLIDLSNGKLAKLWEVVIFKEIFAEELQKDETFFYLLCRNALFPEGTLSYAPYEVIHYKKLDAVFSLLETVLQGFEIKEIDFLKRKLQEKGGKVSFNGVLIDVNFALRLLLEYYRAEKQRKLKLLKEIFLSNPTFEVPNTGKLSVSFIAFKKILAAFREFSDREIASLYRKTWNFGNGAVNFETFLAIAEEEAFFLRTLRVKTFGDFPLKLDFQRNIEKQASSVAKDCVFLKETVENCFDELNFLEKELESRGVLELKQRLKDFRAIFNENFQIPCDLTRNNTCLEVVCNWVGVIAECFKTIVERNDEELRGFVVREAALWSCKVSQKISEVIQKRKQKSLEERNKKARVLQQFFKKKLSKWYTLLSSLLGNKGKSKGKKKNG